MRRFRLILPLAAGALALAAATGAFAKPIVRVLPQLIRACWPPAGPAVDLVRSRLLPPNAAAVAASAATRAATRKPFFILSSLLVVSY